MSLQLILGNSGSGKTHYLYERVIQEAMEHPERNYLVIVPEQFTMATQKELVTRHPNGGILNIDVLSFNRLAHRIFEEVGRDYDGILDDEGKNLILRKIAGDYEKQLKVIGNNLKKFGYISEVKSIISEFTQYKIGEAKLEELKNTVQPHSMLHYKLEDISVIYKGFYQYINEQYITGEELLGKLGNVVRESKILKNSVVTLDGFTGFTPVQESLIVELLKICSDVYLTVTMDETDKFFANMKGQDLFALSKETVDSLTRLTKEHKIQLEKPIILSEKPFYRFANNPTMGFLEQELFRYRGNKYQDYQNVIQAHLHRNPEEESRWVANEIQRMVRTQGYRYQDIAVIASSMDEYGTHLKRACEKQNIPIFSDQKRSILLNSFVEYIRSVLAMVEKNYTYETVFRFLKSGFAPMSTNRVDALETYVLSRGITGYKKWQAPWTKDSERISDQQLAYLNESRVKFVERVQELQYILTQSRKTVEDICTALYEFFLKSNMQKRIEILETQLQEEGRFALAKEYSQIYGTVLDLFDKFVLLLGDEQVSLKEFNDLFDAGLQEARIGIVPPSMDTVIVGDITRTRVGNVKALFFMGNNDNHLPGNMNASGLLSERDREWFEEQCIRLKPNSKQQMYIQKFYLYLILTKPSEKLYISLSKTNSQGKTIRPSYLMGELRKLFPLLKLEEAEMKLDIAELTPEMGLNYLIEGMKDVEIQYSMLWKELYAWYLRHPEWQEEIDLMGTASRYRKSEDNLTKEIAKNLYGNVLKNSVTRLEKFASCPYSHFLSYGLGLKEREIHEFQAVDLGNVFHEAMESYSKKMKEHQKDWATIDEQLQMQWAEECVDASVQDYGYALLFKSERDKYNIERMKRLMKRSVWAVSKQLARGKFEPEGFEVAFGENSELRSTNIVLQEGQKMALRGKIDRVDICNEDDKTYVKILDYKTGNKKLSLSELYYGLQLQLFVYMNAATEMYQEKDKTKRVIPAGVLYYVMNDPIVEVSEADTDVEMSILKELTPDGLVNSDEYVIRLLDEEIESDSYAIPVGKGSRGEYKKSSKIVNEDSFQVIADFTNQKVKKLGEEIVGGNIGITPCQDGDTTACDYCKYGKICGFDKKIPGYEFHKLQKYKDANALGLLQEFIENEEEEESSHGNELD